MRLVDGDRRGGGAEDTHGDCLWMLFGDGVAWNENSSLVHGCLSGQWKVTQIIL